MPTSARLEVRLDTSLESLIDHFPRAAGGAVLATVVATAGSTYRKPGARMLILGDGGYHGLLSGGCLEADLAIHAHRVLETGVPSAVEYDMRGPDDILFGIGAGCEGAMRVLLEPAGPESPAAGALAAAGRITRGGAAASLIAVHEAAQVRLGTYDGLGALPPRLARAAQSAIEEGRSQALDFLDAGCRTRAMVQLLSPPPHLLICGAGPDATPVVDAAVTLGWQVSVVDHRPAYADPGRFPGARVRRTAARELAGAVDLEHCHAAVVMSHHLESDVAYLRALANAGRPSYIGLLGPAARRRRIFQELGAVAELLHERLHGPVGIDIGAVTPEGIALSIVSQIHAWLAGRPC